GVVHLGVLASRSDLQSRCPGNLGELIQRTDGWSPRPTFGASSVARSRFPSQVVEFAPVPHRDDVDALAAVVEMHHSPVVVLFDSYGGSRTSWVHPRVIGVIHNADQAIHVQAVPFDVAHHLGGESNTPSLQPRLDHRRGIGRRNNLAALWVGDLTGLGDVMTRLRPRGRDLICHGYEALTQSPRRLRGEANRRAGNVNDN